MKRRRTYCITGKARKSKNPFTCLLKDCVVFVSSCSDVILHFIDSEAEDKSADTVIVNFFPKSPVDVGLGVFLPRVPVPVTSISGCGGGVVDALPSREEEVIVFAPKSFSELLRFPMRVDNSCAEDVRDFDFMESDEFLGVFLRLSFGLGRGEAIRLLDRGESVE